MTINTILLMWHIIFNKLPRGLEEITLFFYVIEISGPSNMLERT